MANSNNFAEFLLEIEAIKQRQLRCKAEERKMAYYLIGIFILLIAIGLIIISY